MPFYVLYDTRDGAVIGIHSEVIAGQQDTATLTHEEVLAAAMPENPDIDVAVLEVADHPRPRRGYRLVVDPHLRQAIEVEAPSAE